MPPSDTNRVRELSAALDRGESEAIALALELAADAILIDEQAGRAMANGLGLEVIGTLGVLERAKRRNLVQQALPLLDRVVAETNVLRQ